MVTRKAGISILVVALFLALLIPAAAFADQATYTLSTDKPATKTYKIKSIEGASAVTTAVQIAKQAYPSGVPS